MIHKLESAGLGYHVKADESEDRLGRERYLGLNFLRILLENLFLERRVLTALLITGGAFFNVE